MKDHYIPCLLLSQFTMGAATGRKAQVWQIRRDGAHPSRPVAAQDLAHAGSFYSHSDFPDLDDAGLNHRETEAARLIAKLRRGDDPQEHAVELAALVAVQSARTKALRDWAASRFGGGVERLLEQLEGARGFETMRRWVRNMIGDESPAALVRLGVPKHVATHAKDMLDAKGISLVQFADQQVPHLLQVLVNSAREKLESSVLKQAVGKGQIQAMHSIVGAGATRGPLADASWVRIESGSDPFILGDGCVVVRGADGTNGWMARHGHDWREAYLPISKECAVVGLAKNGPARPTLDATALNRASAQLSWSYIYSSRCSPVELDLGALIGSEEPALTDADMDEVVSELLARDSID